MNSSKSIIWVFMAIGSAIGGYLPTLWGAGFLSLWSVLLTAVGGIFGVWLGFKLSD